MKDSLLPLLNEPVYSMVSQGVSNWQAIQRTVHRYCVPSKTIRPIKLTGIGYTCEIYIYAPTTKNCMGRRIFISFAHEDKQQVQGFALLQWNPNVNFEFVGRHLISPVESNDEAYVRSKIREKLDGTSATVVLIGPHTAESEWVDFEVHESLERGNGVIGIRLKGAEGAPVPQVLKDEGRRVINWEPDKFSDEIERAALIAGRPVLGVAPSGGGGGGGGIASRCGR